MTGLYHSSGHSFLVCPRLLDLDPRHAEHWSKGPHCRYGRACLEEHDHEAALPDGQGHMVVDFHWLPGCRPPMADEHPVCACGAHLVYADLDDLYGAEHLEVVD